jgi:hypothetical protein
LQFCVAVVDIAAQPLSSTQNLDENILCGFFLTPDADRGRLQGLEIYLDSSEYRCKGWGFSAFVAVELRENRRHGLVHSAYVSCVSSPFQRVFTLIPLFTSHILVHEESAWSKLRLVMVCDNRRMPLSVLNFERFKRVSASPQGNKPAPFLLAGYPTA